MEAIFIYLGGAEILNNLTPVAHHTTPRARPAFWTFAYSYFNLLLYCATVGQLYKKIEVGFRISLSDGIGT